MNDAPETLARLLGNGGIFIFGSEESANSFPCLRATNPDGCQPYELVVEGTVVLRGLTAADSLLVWGAAYYVLNLQCRVTKNLCWFLRSHVLHTPAEDAVPDLRASKEVDALMKVM